MLRTMARLTCLVLVITLATGQVEQRGLPLDKFMTPQELEETGVKNLTSAQRRALEIWLAKYTRKLVRTVVNNPSHFESMLGSHATPPSSDYPNSGSGHWISEVDSDGALVMLEDGSTWRIADSDQIDTVLWLPTTEITVLKVHDAAGEYNYLLVNTEDNENAHAKYLGKK